MQRERVTTILAVMFILGLGILGWFLTRKLPSSFETSIMENGTQTPSEVLKEELVPGTGSEAKTGDMLTVHYRGTLEDGTVFDSSYDRGSPFNFRLGAGEVIRGWDDGLLGMKPGGKRKLTIPPRLAYGERGQGPIPPNATLIFEVELLKIN